MIAQENTISLTETQVTKASGTIREWLQSKHIVPIILGLSESFNIDESSTIQLIFNAAYTGSYLDSEIENEIKNIIKETRPWIEKTPWDPLIKAMRENQLSVLESKECLPVLKSIFEPIQLAEKDNPTDSTLEEIIKTKLILGSKPFNKIYKFLQQKYDLIRQPDTLEVFVLNEDGLYQRLSLVDLHKILNKHWEFEFSLRDCEKIFDYVSEYRDGEKNIIQFNNCFLDVNTLEEKDEILFCQRQIPWNYDAYAEPLILEKELKEMLRDDYESFLMMVGYMLTTHHKDEKLFFLIGERGTGKSTLGRILSELFGNEQVSNVPLQNIAANDFQAANIVNKIINIVDDTNLGKISNVGLLNSIASGTALEINPKYQRTKKVSGHNLPKLLVMGNSVPIIEDPAGAIYERIVLMRTHKKFRQTDDVDTDFMDKLGREDFEWLIYAGIQAYKNNSWNNNADEIEEKYNLESDPILTAIQILYEIDFDDTDGINQNEIMKQVKKQLKHFFENGLIVSLPILTVNDLNKRMEKIGSHKTRKQDTTEDITTRYYAFNYLKTRKPSEDKNHYLFNKTMTG